jgi:autotransporter-associated beta strand protein
MKNPSPLIAHHGLAIRRRTPKRSTRPQVCLQLLQLEDRVTPAVSASVVANVLTVTLSAPGDHAFITSSASGIRVGTTANGTEALADTTGIVRINLVDSGANANQSVNFDGTSVFTLASSGGVRISSAGIETINLNQAISATTLISGDAATVNVALPGQIQVGVNLVANGGTVNVNNGTYNENVVINNKNLTLQSVNGRTATKIVGTTGVASGTIQLAGTTTGVQIGTTGKGFHIVGFDGPSAGIEVGAVYIGGTHSNLSIIDNEIEANGDHGLIAEFAAVLNNVTVSNNIFSGQTFVGPNPAGVGFSAQFTLNNVPRQLVLFGNGGGSGPSNVTNLTFTNNQITGTTGGISLTDNSGNPNAPTPQGNTLVTLDVSNSTISGNTFAGTTTAFASALRVRRPNTTISGNTFNSTNMTDTTNNLFVLNNTTPLQTIAAANTYDRGAYHVGGTTVWQTIQAAVAAAAITGTTVAVLPTTGGYAENVVVQRPDNKLQSISFQFHSSTVSVNPSSGDAFTIPNGVTAFFNSTFVTTAPTVVQAGGTMGGNGGVTGPVTINATGTMAPGVSPGTTNTGNYVQDGKLDIEIVRPLTTTVAGTDYDQVNVTGTVTLNPGAQLNLIFTGSGTIPTGKSITLINNDGTDPVTGTFTTISDNNIPVAVTPFLSGFTFNAGGVGWFLTYSGGDGNDVVLTSVPLLTVAYVSPTWGSLGIGTPITDADFGTAGNQPAVFGYDAFATIAAAQAAVGAGGTIIVNAGSYAATTLTGTQTLEITGPDAAQAVSIGSLTTSAGQTVILEGTSTLTVGDATSTTIAGVLSGTGNLVKQGSGTLTLSGANTYTGTTTVNAGTLLVTGSTTSGTTVNSTATLGGTGSIAAPVAVNPGGTLNPGVAVGILSTGNYTQTGNLTIEIVNPISPATAGTDYDQLSVTGTVTLNPGATLTLAFVGSGQVPAETIYTLIANDGIDAVVGTFAGLPEGKIFTANGQRWQISYVGGDGNDVTLRALPPGNRLAVGAGTAAVGNPVVVYNPDLSVNSTANPYPQFAGGVRVASADVTGDGIADLITAPGVGGGPHIQVFDGVSGALLNSFFAFEDTFRGGAFVAGGDLDGDGLAEVIVSADFGGGPRVVVFRGSAVASGQFVDGQTGDGVLVSFFGIPDPSFRGGARVAVGDVNGDGVPDVVVAAGEGGGPRVVVWDGKLLAGGMVPAAPLADFFAFDETLRTGAYVSVGDVTGDGLADLLIGAGPGGGPRVRLVDALSLLGLGGVGTLDGNLAGAELGSFFSGDASLRAGVPVAAADLDEDGLAELFSGAGAGQGGSVRVYLGSQLQSAPSNPPINTELEPFGPGLFSGLFVG